MKKRFSVTIDETLVKWIDRNVDRKTFANRSHGLEFCINIVRDIPDKNFMINYVPDDISKTLAKHDSKSIHNALECFNKLSEEEQNKLLKKAEGRGKLLN